MTDRLRFATEHNEPEIARILQALGFTVTPYGQGMLINSARKILAGVCTPQRWMPDYLVERPAISGRPRVPAALRGKYAFLVDAKYRWPNQHNYSVEMRSLLAAPTFGMDLYYVLSTRCA